MFYYIDNEHSAKMDLSDYSELKCGGGRRAFSFINLSDELSFLKLIKHELLKIKRRLKSAAFRLRSEFYFNIYSSEVAEQSPVDLYEDGIALFGEIKGWLVAISKRIKELKKLNKAKLNSK